MATVTVDPDVKDQRILLLKTADRGMVASNKIGTSLKHALISNTPDELSDGLRAKLDEGGAASLVDQSITLPYEYWRAGETGS